MAIWDLFSKRQKRLRGEAPDVFTYDKLPDILRVQIVHIVCDAIGKDAPYHFAVDIYKSAHKALCREYGLFTLGKPGEGNQEALMHFILDANNTERMLDTIEVLFNHIDTTIHDNWFRCQNQVEMSPDEAITELNTRFIENCFGYQYESGEIIRVDSEFMHSEIVKPTLTVLHNKSFSGANEEFLKAHEHYRNGRHKECLVEALKAFESTIKAICAQRGWTTAPTDTAKKLIATCLNKELVPPFLQAEFTSLAAMLEGGVPTVRNKFGGHGQGTTPIQVPAYMARYALNTTASCILLLAEANDALK